MVKTGPNDFMTGFHYFAIRASGTNDRAFPERLAYYVVIRILPWPIGAHPTSRATRVLYSTTHVSLARARARGLGRVLYSTRVAREVARHLSAAVYRIP